MIGIFWEVFQQLMYGFPNTDPNGDGMCDLDTYCGWLVAHEDVIVING